MASLEAARLQTILVIDDEATLRQSLCDQLEDLGYLVLAAAQGQAGLELVERENPDLILTDLRMPIMNGLEVIKRCQELVPDTPIVVISGAGRIDEATEALRRGAYDYLTKPIGELSVLRHTVDKAMENARLRRENRAHQEHLEAQVLERTADLKQANSQLTNINERLRKIVRSTSSLAVCSEIMAFGSKLLDEFAEHTVFLRFVIAVEGPVEPAAVASGRENGQEEQEKVETLSQLVAALFLRPRFFLEDLLVDVRDDGLAELLEQHGEEGRFLAGADRSRNLQGVVFARELLFDLLQEDGFTGAAYAREAEDAAARGVDEAPKPRE